MKIVSILKDTDFKKINFAVHTRYDTLKFFNENIDPLRSFNGLRMENR